MSGVELALWCIFGLLYISFNLSRLEKKIETHQLEWNLLESRTRALIGLVCAVFLLPLIIVLAIIQLITGREMT